jgi:hypothetical protein
MRWYFIQNLIQPDWPFYCPQEIPDYLVDFNIVYSFTDTNYCLQTLPDYEISGVGVIQTQTDTDYCPQDTTGFFDIDYELITEVQADTDYCPQNTNLFFNIDLTYCAQDLTVLNRDIIGAPPYNMASELVYCQQDLTVLNRTP